MLTAYDRDFLRTHAPFYIHWRSFIVITTLLGISLYLTYVRNEEWSFARYEAVFWLAAVIIPITWFQIYTAKGYRVSWDKAAIYIEQDRMTQWGHKAKERAIRYEDIERVVDMERAVGAMGITPFEVIRIFERGADEDNIPSFYLTALYLYPAEMKAFVRMLYERRPETFAQGVIDWLEQPKWDPVEEKSYLDD